MNWYSIGKVATYVSELDAYPEDDSFRDDIEEYITALHELELKSSYISRLKDVDEIFPQRKFNIIKRLHDIGWRYFVISRDGIIGSFDEWLEQHQINDVDLWVDNLMNMFEETYTDNEEVVSSIFNDGFKIGRRELGIAIDGNDLVSEVDEDVVRSYISEDFYNNLDSYDKTIEEFLEINFEEEFDDSGMELVDFIEEKNLVDDVFEFLLESLDLSSYVEDYDAYFLVDIEAVRNALKNKLYPRYMANFGIQIEEVIESIEGAKERLYSIKESDSLSIMTMAISLALNVMHVHGNIMTDYGGSKISTRYLDWLNEGGDSELWQEEAKNEFLSGIPSGSNAEN